MDNSRTITIVIALAVAAVASAFLMWGNLSTTDKATASVATCPEINIAQMQTRFSIKQPTLQSLPPNYDLRGAEQYQDEIVLYYTDRSVCPNGGNPLEEVEKGAILMSIEAVTPTTSKDFANQMIERIQNDKSAGMTPQLVNINGKSGVGWEMFEGADVLNINGTVVDSHPVQRPARITFYDESDKTVYTIVGMRSMQDLLAIAKSVS
jgi:hypothetical protein